MQREIIFRGKWIGNEKWIQGNLARFSNGDCAICNMDSVDEEPLYYLVDPDTVGQYTGMDSNSGWKIFEGDLLRYRENVFEVRYSTEQARFLAYLSNGIFNPAVLKNGEIIGNIYDNPELMEDK